MEMDRKLGGPYLGSFKSSNKLKTIPVGMTTSADLEAAVQSHSQRVAKEFLKSLEAAKIKQPVTSHEMKASKQHQVDSPSNLAQVLDLADRFCKTFVDSVAEYWNKPLENIAHGGSGDHSSSTQVTLGHGGSGDDHSQHGDSGDEEDEMLENSLYQTCNFERLDTAEDDLSSPTDPLYANPSEVDYQSLKKRPPAHTQNMLGGTGGGERAVCDNIYDQANCHDDMLRPARQATKPPGKGPPGYGGVPAPSMTGGSDGAALSPPSTKVLGADSNEIKQADTSLEAQLAEAFALQHSKSLEEDGAAQFSAQGCSGHRRKLSLSLFTGAPKSSSSPQSAPVSTGGPTPPPTYRSTSSGQPKLKDAFIDFTSDMACMLKRSSPKHQACPTSQQPGPNTPLVPMTPAMTVQKEGVVELLVPSSQGQQLWKACRLVLLKTHGGTMLNLYLPPESDKATSGIFCPLIYEAREAKPNEFRSHECIMIVKADGGVQSVIRCRSFEQRHDWLCVVQDQMKGTNSSGCLSTSSSSYSMDHGEVFSPCPDSSGPDLSDGYTSAACGIDPCLTPIYSSSQSSPTHRARADSASTPTNEDPHPYTSQLSRKPSCGDYDCITVAPTSQMVTYSSQSMSVTSLTSMESSHLERLNKFPWFHGQMGRAEAASKVLQQGVAGHGVYLVRQSETKEEELCLTFNYQGKAKHLRMSLDPDEGTCHVQHLQFRSLPSMIEHYRSNPLPIGTKEGVPITLRSYIMNLQTGDNSQTGVIGVAGASTNPNRVSMHRRNKSVDFDLESSLLDHPRGGGVPGGRHMSMSGHHNNASQTPNMTKKSSFNQ